jgi:putative hydrolase of HD superfamily
MSLDIYSEGLVEIGKLALTFAKIDRATFHEDGIRSESDTDHTVMLALCACALADALYKDTLNIGKVSQFAIVHDLVEVYAGDTNSINLSHQDKELKEKKESESLAIIAQQFAHVYPWIDETIREYESLSTREARFVKVLDKVMTKITNILDRGAGLKKHDLSRDEIVSHYEKQRTALSKHKEEFPELLNILDMLSERMFQEVYGNGHGIIHR